MPFLQTNSVFTPYLYSTESVHRRTKKTTEYLNLDRTPNWHRMDMYPPHTSPVPTRLKGTPPLLTRAA